MKREIKFRAWDGKRMIYTGDKVYPSHFDNELKAVTDPCKVYHDMVEVWVHEAKLQDATEAHFDHPSYVYAKEIMQFTGLKDKNGKEIYEGDIVRLKANYLKNVKKEEPTDWKESIHSIKFFDGMFALDRGLPFNNGFVKDGEIEIIGNIYENPELT